MLRIALVDDEIDCLDNLKDNLDKILKEENTQYVINTSNNSFPFLKEIDVGNKYDIIFLDIEMDRMNGIELAKAIRKFDEEVIIIFQTKMGKYAIQGYSVNAFDYILKPIEFDNLKLKMHRIISKLKKDDANLVQLYTQEKKLKYISIDSIIYIEVLQHTLTIYSETGQYNLYGSLNDFEQKFPNSNIVRVSRFYAVNLKYVIEFKNNIIKLPNKEIPVGRTLKHNFVKCLENSK